MKRLSHFLVSLILIFSATAYSQPFRKAEQTTLDFTSNLPIVKINTNGQTIKNSPKIVVNLAIIYNGEGIRNDYNDLPNNYNGKIAIEIRGSSSQMFPKKQYALETRDSLNNDLDVSLLGLPKDNDWILYAPYTDKSMMRDVLAFKIWQDMGYYASRWKYCELFLNEEYKGVYILFEKVKRGKNRVNVSKLNPEDSLQTTITGGYIIKVDKWDGDNNDGFQSLYNLPSSSIKIYYQYHYPKPEDINPLQKTYIKTLVRAFESAMNGSSFADTLVGYSKYIDVNSFVDNLIFNEFTRNVDGYRLSAFFNKDRDDKRTKIFAGPVWDNNLSFGNADYNDGWYVNGWELEFLSTNINFLSSDPFPPPFWWRKLFNEPKFFELVKTRWKEWRKEVLNTNNINNFIDSLASNLNEAQKRNYQQWQILNEYVWPNPWDVVSANTFAKQITYLKNWIKNRTLWIDSQLGTTDVNNNSPEIPNKFSLEQNYPNPFNPVTKIKFKIPAYLNPFKRGTLVTLKVYDILGTEVATLVDEDKPAGVYEVEFSSKEGSGGKVRNFSSGIYFYTLHVGDYSATKKMILMK